MKKYFWILFILIIFFSCEKELDFKYHKVESQFVIEGTLDEEGAKISLSYTIPMDEPFNEQPYIEAEVSLKDMTANKVFTLCYENGVFYNEIPGIPGHTYELSVEHNGKRFVTDCLMRKGVEILDLRLQWIKMPYDHVAVLEITSTVSDADDTCYWTKIYKNGEPYKWLMSHGSGVINGILTQTTFTTRQNPVKEDKDNLKDGDILKVIILPISLKMYDYLIGISSDSNGPTMFSGDFCLGYFLASEETESEITFHPDDLPCYQFM